MKKILWLASWYPNKMSPLNGDFIQRHAEAVAIFEIVHVLFVVKDEYGLVTDHLKVENTIRGNLNECIAYYKPWASGLKFLDRIISMVTYFNILRRLSLLFIKEHGKPALVHVHVAMWSGIMALWLKKKKNIPYLLTEHWTGYDENAIENVYNKGWFFKYLSKLIIKHADMMLPVSRQLGECIEHNIAPVTFKVVSNVVDTQHFNLFNHSTKEFTFIHVSSMSRQKNVEELLNSFSKLLSYRSCCKLLLAGPASILLKDKATQLGLDKCIEWTGEITNTAVATKMAGSSALVLFSRYENLPCVILEALCCGLPVIATGVGGVPEIITANNGLLVTSGDEFQLLQAMIKMIDNYQSYDRSQISQLAVSQYNYNTIGKIISDLYLPYKVP